MQLRSNSKFDTGVATHRGNVRAQNEDAHVVLPESGLWAVSDGMGGHEAGQLASSTIVAALQSIKPQSSARRLLAACEDRVRRANSSLEQIRNERGGSIMGATLAVLLIYDAHYACVWAGDSRVYCIRNGNIWQVSHDHTEVQALIDKGVLTPEEAITWPQRGVITRAIGTSDHPELDVEMGPLLDGDIFVICSDGLTAHVSDREILERVVPNRSQNACELLVELSLERGGEDNVTVIVVRCGGITPAKSGAPARLIWE